MSSSETLKWKTLSRWSTVTALRRIARKVDRGPKEQEYRYSEYLDFTTGEYIIRVSPVDKNSNHQHSSE